MFVGNGMSNRVEMGGGEIQGCVQDDGDLVASGGQALHQVEVAPVTTGPNLLVQEKSKNIHHGHREGISPAVYGSTDDARLLPVASRRNSAARRTIPCPDFSGPS
jgi:hypothetical protein